MIKITDVISIVKEMVPNANLEIINKAYNYSARVHSGQYRLSGEPYLSHLLEVAAILAKMKLDSVSVASGLLHDVIEDTQITEEEFGKIFGPSIKHIVSGVTKLSKITFDDSKVRTVESFRKMLSAMADDVRVILIKLADRLHNMRTLQFHKSEIKRKKISEETINIYAPIALRLGIYWIKTELEDIALKYMDSDAYEKISRLVSRDKKLREDYVETVRKYIMEILNTSNLECKIIGRYKSIYSIHQKMKKQNIPFEEVHDVVAFRVILKSTEDCYNALGCIHKHWKAVPNRIKDYIGMPKQNMYQSLHTTVIDPSGSRVEIQIRTEEMEKIAEFGIAAHWGYKRNEAADMNSEKFEWIRDIIENQKYASNPDEFLEILQTDLFPNRIYVFTPDGSIKFFPEGATPVDLAYNIGSELGNKCIGCKVNGRMVSLEYKLCNGEVAEVVTGKDQVPTRNWLDFVKTIKARFEIRQWVEKKKHMRSISLGYEICAKIFSKYKLNFQTIIKQDVMQNVMLSFGFNSKEELLADVGYGRITVQEIFEKIGISKGYFKNSLFHRIMKKMKKDKDIDRIIIDRYDDMLINFGECCQPIPFDPIMGEMTFGLGIIVHKVKCLKIIDISPERKINVEWGIMLDELHPINIVVNSVDRIGLLADITKHISDGRINIVNADIKTFGKGNIACYFTISAKNARQLDRLISLLKKISHVIDVKRMT